MALQERDPAFMAGMGKLANELTDEIIRWTVKKQSMIDIRHLEREVDMLLAPFAGDEKLLGVAEQEVFRVNTFRLSIADTGVEVTGRSAGKGLHDGRVVWTRHLVSLTTGPIAGAHRRIRHLEVHLANCVEGAKFTRRFEPIGDLDKQVTDILSAMDELFPELASLHVKVHNQGTVRYGNGLGVHVLPGGTVLPITDPKSRRWAHKERMLRMHHFLLFFGACVDPPRLREKTVEFIQDAASTAVLEFDGRTFLRTHSAAVKDYAGSAIGWQKLRRGQMACAMLGWSLADLAHHCLTNSRAPLEAFDIDEDLGRRDLKAMKKLLRRCGRSRVRYPCGR